jgi:hypothetical protein
LFWLGYDQRFWLSFKKNGIIPPWGLIVPERGGGRQAVAEDIRQMRLFTSDPSAL